MDGEPHNFVLEDSDEGIVIETEVVEEEGATQTVEFSGDNQYKGEYYCSVHPENMRGEVASFEGSIVTPTADFEDQETDGTYVVVEIRVYFDSEAYIGIYDHEILDENTEGSLGYETEQEAFEKAFLGVSDRLGPGRHENVEIELDPPLTEDKTLMAGIQFGPEPGDVIYDAAYMLYPADITVTEGTDEEQESEEEQPVVEEGDDEEVETGNETEEDELGGGPGNETEGGDEESEAANESGVDVEDDKEMEDDLEGDSDNETGEHGEENESGPEENVNETEEDNGMTDVDNEQPGFGIFAGISGIGGLIIYYLKSRGEKEHSDNS